jgi:hypothetical protein
MQIRSMDVRRARGVHQEVSITRGAHSSCWAGRPKTAADPRRWVLQAPEKPAVTPR